MGKTKRQYAPSVPYEAVLADHMKDPGFRRAYDELEPEFAIIKQIIDLRLKRRMSQTQLAKRIGTQQPSIARLESRGHVRNLDYLQRVANALDARLEVRLVPLKASARSAASQRAMKGTPASRAKARTARKV